MNVPKLKENCTNTFSDVLYFEDYLPHFLNEFSAIYCCEISMGTRINLYQDI